METNSGQEMRVAVKCKVCQRVIFYKTTPLSGKIELKCPKCHQITQAFLFTAGFHRAAIRPEGFFHIHAPFATRCFTKTAIAAPKPTS